ncbi:MAG TPA: NAD-dependent epimerase/dehydratase family protein [Chthoniobacterales bacterium]|nr:NAD-dependent epimerase/dehydratase family protein [Chthoniobacterales bacterium]
MITNAIVKEDLTSIHEAVGLRGRWSGAVIVITGCAGFLGFYLTQYLVRYAAELRIRKVIGLDTFLLGKPRWLLQLAEEFQEVFFLQSFDISNDRIEDVGEAKSARYVIHAASIASPTFYRQHPLETIDANVWGLRRLLDFYKDAGGLEGFLFFSSSEIYGDPDPQFIPTEETYRGNVACLGPRACYDESKRFGETLSYVFATLHGMPITIVRPFNNYGPGMRAGDNRLPADLADAVLGRRDITLWSDGSPKRTYCYVSDAVSGYFLALLHGKYDFFNIGSDKQEIAVRELAETYRAAGAEIFGYSGKVNYQKSSDSQYLTHNPGRRRPDVRKARETLGYNPKIEVDEGVRRHLQFLSNEGPGES